MTDCSTSPPPSRWARNPGIVADRVCMNAVNAFTVALARVSRTVTAVLDGHGIRVSSKLFSETYLKVREEQPSRPGGHLISQVSLPSRPSFEGNSP